MADAKPLKLVDQGGGAGRLAEFEAGDTLPKAALPALSAADVGLGNVDNTSDANKPISTAAATALAGKLDTTGTAADSSRLGGQLPAYYATAAQVGDIATALDLINGEVI